MEDNFDGFEDAEENKPIKKQSISRKIWLEFTDMLAGVAFPLILTIIFSSAIISFASTSDLALSIIALVGGEILLVGALIIFGRANGANAYKNTVEHAQKRELGSTDEKVNYRTGEYALWKGAVIALMVCVPFIIFQTIELIVPNTFTGFCMRYVFAWAFYPFSYLGKEYQALNYIMIILPVGVHMLGYHLGKLKEMKIRQKLAESAEYRKKQRKK